MKRSSIAASYRRRLTKYLKRPELSIGRNGDMVWRGVSIRPLFTWVRLLNYPPPQDTNRCEPLVFSFPSLPIETSLLLTLFLLLLSLHQVGSSSSPTFGNPCVSCLDHALWSPESNYGGRCGVGCSHIL
jgi:hypothetical protein